MGPTTRSVIQSQRLASKLPTRVEFDIASSLPAVGGVSRAIRPFLAGKLLRPTGHVGKGRWKGGHHAIPTGSAVCSQGGGVRLQPLWLLVLRAPDSSHG